MCKPCTCGSLSAMESLHVRFGLTNCSYVLMRDVSLSSHDRCPSAMLSSEAALLTKDYCESIKRNRRLKRVQWVDLRPAPITPTQLRTLKHRQPIMSWTLYSAIPVAVFATYLYFLSPNPVPGPLVDLGYSSYTGVFDSQTNITHFYGIRYAAPPVGKWLFLITSDPAQRYCIRFPPFCGSTIAS
jgi:hypothetical protein